MSVCLFVQITDVRSGLVQSIKVMHSEKSLNYIEKKSLRSQLSFQTRSARGLFVGASFESKHSLTSSLMPLITRYRTSSRRSFHPIKLIKPLPQPLTITMTVTNQPQAHKRPTRVAFPRFCFCGKSTRHACSDCRACTAGINTWHMPVADQSIFDFH